MYPQISLQRSAEIPGYLQRSLANCRDPWLSAEIPGYLQSSLAICSNRWNTIPTVRIVLVLVIFSKDSNTNTRAILNRNLESLFKRSQNLMISDNIVYFMIKFTYPWQKHKIFEYWLQIITIILILYPLSKPSWLSKFHVPKLIIQICVASVL